MTINRVKGHKVINPIITCSRREVCRRHRYSRHRCYNTMNITHIFNTQILHHELSKTIIFSPEKMSLLFTSLSVLCSLRRSLFIHSVCPKNPVTFIRFTTLSSIHGIMKQVCASYIL